MIRCRRCGKELPSEFGEMPRKPCPDCESTVRDFFLEAEPGDFLVVGGSVSLVHTRPGVQSTAQADDQGKITLMAIGPGPRNEEGANEVCARLVRVLNSAGGAWTEPVEGKQDIDGCSMNAAGEQLQMQVIRASNNGKMWHEINRTGSATIIYDVAGVAGELIDAVRKKAAKYPPAQKREMTLVLDAARTPSHTFQQVLEAFRRQYLQECSKAGFAQVSAVGPCDSLVVRLDV